MNSENTNTSRDVSPKKETNIVYSAGMACAPMRPKCVALCDLCLRLWECPKQELDLYISMATGCLWLAFRYYPKGKTKKHIQTLGAQLGCLFCLQAVSLSGVALQENPDEVWPF